MYGDALLGMISNTNPNLRQGQASVNGDEATNLLVASYSLQLTRCKIRIIDIFLYLKSVAFL